MPVSALERARQSRKPKAKVWAATAGAGIGVTGSVVSGLAGATAILLAGLLGQFGWTVTEEELHALAVLSAALWAAVGAFGFGYIKTETVQ